MPKVPNQIEMLPVESIHVERAARQRTVIDVDDLIPSIRLRGVLNPIIVDENAKLIAGERRLTAAKKLGLKTIPCRRYAGLPASEREAIELDENCKRADLPWQDKVKAMQRMLHLYRLTEPDLTIADFADRIGYSISAVRNFLNVAERAEAGDQRVLKAATVSKAVNVIAREQQREKSNKLAQIFDAATTAPPTAEAPPLQAESILNMDFVEWAQTYQGEKFNLIHCDFPYGIDLGESEQIGQHKAYADEEKVYWNLLKQFAENRSRFLSKSAHLFFWFHPKLWTETWAFMSQQMPEITWDEVPLVWHKTDNKGVVPDVTRRPRRVTEFCLFGWRGDRRIVSPVSNAYGAPKANSPHVSEKPRPVLSHFFSMVVDKSTRMLDPTCGTGSSLQAAEGLGAGHVLGIELDQAYAEHAQAKLRQFRTMREITKQGEVA